jgi:hypothetical protein
MGGSGSGNGTSTASCGLNPNTQYYYTIYFYDQNGVFITQYSGAFTTTI